MIQYVFGDDTFTARKNIHEAAESLGASIRWIDAEESEKESIEALFDSARGSLLGTMFVVIQDPSLYPEELRDRILENCEKQQSGNILLWDRAVDKRLAFHKKIKRLVDSKEVSSPIDEQGMVKWITAYAPDISVPVAQELVRRVGLDVWSATTEIDKLRALPSPVSVSDVQRTVAQRDTSYASAFPLLDAITRKQRAVALRLLGEMFDGGASERFILAMLAYQFRLFLAVQIGKDSGENISSMKEKTGLHPVAIQKAIPMASRLSVPVLSEILGKIAATEKSLVTTTMDPKSIVTMLVIGLCR